MELVLYIAIYIWAYWGPRKNPWSHFTHAATFLLIAYPPLSNGVQIKTWHQMGLDWKGMLPGLYCISLYGTPVALILFWLGSDKSLDLSRLYPDGWMVSLGSWDVYIRSAATFAGLYTMYALIQQYVLMGFLFNRLHILFEDSLRAATWGWILYAYSHYPNPVLMLASLLGGFLFFIIFVQCRNFLPLVILHAILGILVFKAFGKIIPGFHVGQNYYGDLADHMRR